MRAERNAYRNQVWVPQLPFPRYSLVAGNIRLLPIPPVTTGRILYAPTATQLVGVNDPITFPSNWEKYVIVYAAMQMLMKEESSVNALAALLAQFDNDLLELKDNRDAAFPKQTVDRDKLDYEDVWFF